MNIEYAESIGRVNLSQRMCMGYMHSRSLSACTIFDSSIAEYRLAHALCGSFPAASTPLEDFR